MPINTFNVGRDVAIDFVGPTGPVRLSIVTGLPGEADDEEAGSHGIDGTVRFQYIPGGWDGHIKIDRANRLADDLIYNFEQLYYGGQNVPAVAIVETITEPTARSPVALRGRHVRDARARQLEGDAKVEQRLEWCASFRKLVQYAIQDAGRCL
jgi:hypothetical protein